MGQEGVEFLCSVRVTFKARIGMGTVRVGVQGRPHWESKTEQGPEGSEGVNPEVSGEQHFRQREQQVQRPRGFKHTDFELPTRHPSGAAEGVAACRKTLEFGGDHREHLLLLWAHLPPGRVTNCPGFPGTERFSRLQNSQF